MVGCHHLQRKWLIKALEALAILGLKALNRSLTFDVEIKIEEELDCLEAMNIIDKSTVELTEVSLVVEDI